MKASLTLAAALLAASPAIAGVVPFNGILPGKPSRRDLGRAVEISERAACNEDNVLRALQNPTRSVGASSFCSAYLQPTNVITSTATIPATTVVTVTSTASQSTTTVAVSTSVATTITCAASPTAPVTCDLAGYGYPEHLISQTPYIDSVTCHEMCLQDPTCQSFQTQPNGQMICNLFSVPTTTSSSPDPTADYFFYDRDCPQLLPPGCAPAPSAKKRDIEARAATTPANLSTVLATVPASRISSACKCLITSAPATATVTVPASIRISTTTTTTAVVTTTGTEVDSSSTTVTAISTAPP